MIEFKYVEWKNFLSTGNHPTRFEFDKDITLILGENGSGKTTILDALVYGLYGVSYRGVKKGQLINNRNRKGLEVRVAFEIDGNRYLVVRGQKPNIFEIYKNDSKVDQLHSVKDMQAYLEDILQMTVKTFKQIVILGSTNYIPFMQLTAQQRREIVENILDMGVFSKMKDVLKEEISSLLDQKNDLERKKIGLDASRQARMDAIDERIRDLQEQEKALVEQISCIREEKFDTKVDLRKEPDIISAMQKIIKAIGAIENSLQVKNSSINRLSGLDTCPTCFQTVPQEHKDKIISGTIESIESLQSQLEELKQKKHKVENALNVINEVKKRLQDMKTKALRLRDQISRIRDEISKCREILEQSQNAPDSDDVEAIDIELKALDVEIDRHKKAMQYLKDDGLRAILVRKYLPHINHYVNHYLSELGLPVKFSLDETFQEKIETPIYDNYSYESFSEGEKMRINLAILFAWRAIAKMRNSVSCNILIFDEILDGSTDEEGIHAFFRMIRNIIREESLRVVVISHTQGAYESKFGRIVVCQKKRGFSTTTVVT